MASLAAQMVNHLPAMWETWVRSLGQEDLLEKEMATHSRTLAWKIPWMEEPGRQQSMGLQRVGHDWATSLVLITKGKTFLFVFLCICMRQWMVTKLTVVITAWCLKFKSLYCTKLIHCYMSIYLNKTRRKNKEEFKIKNKRLMFNAF